VLAITQLLQEVRAAGITHPAAGAAGAWSSRHRER